MDKNLESHFMAYDDSKNIFKNKKKLRIGIMINNYHLDAWKYHMLEVITGSEFASIELIILNDRQDEKKSYIDKIFSNRNRLFYFTYTMLEDQLIQRRPDVFKPTDTHQLLEKVPVIEIKPNRDKNFDWIEEEDVERIKESNLDVIIRLGFGILKGDILTAAKYGVWSYHHDDNTIMRGIPPGFWETFERMGERGAILQELTDDLDNGIVLYRSSFSCDSAFVSVNNNDCFLRSSLFVPRILKKIYTEGENAFFCIIERENKKLNFYNNVLYAIPTNFEFLKLFIKHAYHSTNLVNHFFSHPQWFLMYDLHNQISTSFWRFKKIIPPGDRFWADPHVFFKDDIYYIFIEEYIYKTKHAHISLIEMQQSGKYSDPVKVLEEPFQLTYPHVFEYNGILYMIPETAKTKSINLYRCTDFPIEWRHHATLMDGLNAVDSTILFYKNKWWLFTNIAEPEGTLNHNELFLFSSDNLLSQNWNSHPMNPVISDVKRARSAGKIFERNGILYRPSQCCKPHYGYGIKLNEIVVLTEKEYLEREIAFIEPKWDKNLKGVHTICHENRLTMIDGYYIKLVV